MDWLRSRWDWIVRKFLTCVIVFVVGLLVFGVVMVCRHWGWIVTESGSTIIRNLGLVIGGLIAIGFGIWRGVVASCQAKTSQRGLLNERYQKGAEMLGSEVLSVRLGGIYALQRLAEDVPEQYHVEIMSLFCAFVRHLTKDKDDKTELMGSEGKRKIGAYVEALMISEDVQAVMTAIGTRSADDIKLEKKKKFKPDLSGAQLRGVDLSKQTANLSGVDLSEAVFAPPDTEHLNPTFIESMEVAFAKVPLAILSGADLRSAKLVKANLTQADLTGVDLDGANLTSADLSKATGLTQDQLDKAVADFNKWPDLDGARDAQTRALLTWDEDTGEP